MSGSRPHRPHAQLQMEVEGVQQAPFAIRGNPIMDNVARLNRTGLNGLSQCGTDGLQTVSLAHHPASKRAATPTVLESLLNCVDDGEQRQNAFAENLCS